MAETETADVETELYMWVKKVPIGRYIQLH